MLEPGPTRAVVKVIDGETLGLDDGSEVRLIGALSPKSPDSGGDASHWPPEREAVAELERTALGRSVDLAFAAGRRTDRYNRHLAHVFIPSDDGRRWLQGHMLQAGHARAYVLPGHGGCMAELLAYEQLGRERVAGLWSNAAYQTRSALRTRELTTLRSTYQIVEGRVASVSDVKGRVFLNFGDDHREDFTVTIKPAERRQLLMEGIDVMTLRDVRVRVRGWIDRRGGPSIELTNAAELVIIAPADAAEKPPPAAQKRNRPVGAQPADRDL